MIVLVVTLSLSIAASALAYEDYVGVRQATQWDLSWWTGGYVYINSNATTTLNVQSLVAWIYNDAISNKPVSDRNFYVYGVYTSEYDNYYSPLPWCLPGNSQRIEGYVNKTYQKGPQTSTAVQVGIKTGDYNGFLAGWNIAYFYGTDRTPNFYY